MSENRTKLRIERDLLKRVTHIVQYEIRDPRVQESLVSLSRTEVSADLSILKCHVMVRAAESRQKAVIGVLNRAAGFVRKRLGENLTLRSTPQVRFYLDDTPERAARIDDLLEGLPGTGETAGASPGTDDPADTGTEADGAAGPAGGEAGPDGGTGAAARVGTAPGEEPDPDTR